MNEKHNLKTQQPDSAEHCLLKETQARVLRTAPNYRLHVEVGPKASRPLFWKFQGRLYIAVPLAPLLRNLGHTSYYHALTINNIPTMLLSAPAEVWPLSLSLSLLLCQPRWSIQCKEHNYSDCKASKLGENQSQGRKAQDLLRLRLWQRCYLRPNIEKTFCCKHFAQPACSVHFGELGSWGKAHPAEWLLALCRIPGCCGPSALLWLCRKHVKHLKPRGIKSCAILCCVTPKVEGANTRRLCWW
jgi:hypothetical protein